MFFNNNNWLLILQMTPINLVRHNSLELQQFGGDCIDDSLSMDTQDIVDQPAFTSITEIAVGVNFKYILLHHKESLTTLT